MKIFQSYSSRETTEFASQLAQQLSMDIVADRPAMKPPILRSRGNAQKIQASRKSRLSNALVIALSGDLGAGKTTFTQGFAKGLGIKRRIASPTFVLLRRFPIRRAPFVNLYHIDAYRIKKTDALESIGLGEIFSNPKNIVLVEWPEKIEKILPKNSLWLKFRHGNKENERSLHA